MAPAPGLKRCPSLLERMATYRQASPEEEGSAKGAEPSSPRLIPLALSCAGSAGICNGRACDRGACDGGTCGNACGGACLRACYLSGIFPQGT
jgi:hypothetical protein